MSVTLRSPKGEQREIPDAGVDALLALGWQRVQQQQQASPKRRSKRATSDESAEASEDE